MARKSPSTQHTRSLRTLGLFSGIGGIEHGLAAAGHHSVAMCEIDPGARAVLRARFAGVDLVDDVRSIDAVPRGTQLLAAGFPCQDLSQAGNTAGIAGSRSGLVHEVFRLVKTTRVPWLLIENVPFMLQLARGRALEVIVRQLERLGYRWCYRVVDSRAFGLPQRRERVYLVASLDDDPRTVLLADDARAVDRAIDPGDVACGFYWTEGIRGLGWAVDAVPTLKGGSTLGIPSQPAIWLPGGAIVKPDIRDAERMQGFAVDWTLPAETVARAGHRWKLVGNAVTVDVAAWIGARLAEPGAYTPSDDVPMRAGDRWPRAAWNVGDGRHRSAIGSWPVRRASKPLAAFLRYPAQPLSARATAGFLSRTRVSTLRFPAGFLDAVGAHLRRMESAS